MRHITITATKIMPRGFKLQDLDGREVSLDSLHGKVLLLSFLSPGAVPAEANFRCWLSFQRDWSAKGLVLIRITEETPEQVNRFLKKHIRVFLRS